MHSQGGCATLGGKGRYTTFEYGGRSITFMHGKDHLEYLSVKEWDEGYLVVECRGKVKGVYEDHIELTFILEQLYIDLRAYLRDVREVR